MLLVFFILTTHPTPFLFLSTPRLLVYMSLLFELWLVVCVVRPSQAHLLDFDAVACFRRTFTSPSLLLFTPRTLFIRTARMYFRTFPTHGPPSTPLPAARSLPPTAATSSYPPLLSPSDSPAPFGPSGSRAGAQGAQHAPHAQQPSLGQSSDVRDEERSAQGVLADELPAGVPLPQPLDPPSTSAEPSPGSAVWSTGTPISVRDPKPRKRHSPGESRPSVTAPLLERRTGVLS